MTNHAGENFFRANTPLLVLLIVILITAFTTTTTAKSLYIIADIHAEPTPIQAYNIEANGTLTFQTEYNVPRHSEYGPLGLAIDSHSTILFITHENSNVIQLVNATTMTDAGTTTANSAENLAGIVYDHDKRLLYCVDRGKDKLYVYDWQASTATLNLVPGSPFTLTEATAFGIALDETNDLLYVANNSTTITVYHTSDWSLKESISVSRTAISIAVDATRGLVYSGAGFVYNNYLSQYNLGTQRDRLIKVEPDAGVMGLGVDPATGMIYVGTGANNRTGGDNIKVYNTSLHQIDIITNIGNPTGLVIPIEDISYNPLNLYKNIAGSSTNEVEYVQIGGTVTYTVCFDNKNNDYTVNNVSIVDNLPNEVSFVIADGDGVFGQYDPVTHSYRWSYSSLAAGFPGDCLNLLVNVNRDTAPGTTITNFVTIDSNETGPTTTSFNVVTDVISYNPLNLSKNIIGGSTEQNAACKEWCVGAGDTIIYGICFDNNNNDFPVTNVSIVDKLPSEVSFVTADGDGMFGKYDPMTHTYTWTYPSLSPKSQGDCLQLVVQVNTDTAPNMTITNSVTIDSVETEPATARVDAVTKAISYNPLNLSKNIIGGTTEQSDACKDWCASAGDTIIYGICFDNKNNDNSITNVSIVDTLPRSVSFVRADGDGLFGKYEPITHTYTWTYPSLPPSSPGYCLKLVVQVKKSVIPGMTITNSATIDSDQTEPASSSVDAVIKAITYNPLNLSKKIIGGTIAQTAISEFKCPDVGDTIIYGICFDNKNNDYTVNNVSIVDNLPYEVSFVRAYGDGIFGQYDLITHTYRWYYSSLAPRFTGTCLTLVVKVNQGIIPGKTITNSVTINSNETGLATASVDIVTCPRPLQVNLTVLPEMIRREGCVESILAIVELTGIGASDIKDELLILNPGGIKATSQFVFNKTNRVEIQAWFSTAELLAAVPGYGVVNLEVTGKLKSGQSFTGVDTIIIAKFTGS